MSANFTDPKGNDWKLVLTYGSACAVKRETGVNLTMALRKDADWMELLFGDAERIVGVLWVLCEEQAKERGITPEQFGYLFNGTTLEAAGVALANAIADFFPRSKIGTAIRKGLTQALAVADQRGVEALEHKMAKLTGSPSASNAPASAESIPDG